MLWCTQEGLCSFELVFWFPSDIFPEVGSQGQKADPLHLGNGAISQLFISTTNILITDDET